MTLSITYNTDIMFLPEYPEFYEFVANKETQETAGRIFGYVQTGIGEFIAETYAE